MYADRYVSAIALTTSDVTSPRAARATSCRTTSVAASTSSASCGDVYERYGFEPLETPAFENIETLLGKYGEEGNKLIFKILRRGEHEASGEADLALRYDLTVPLARVVAQYQDELPKFFKRYQIQPVWRADRPARGRFREFYQCDIDAIGSTSPVVEAEHAARRSSDVLDGARVSTTSSIRLNHRQVLGGVARARLSVPDEQHGDALVALDKLDKIGRDGVVEGTRERAASSGTPPRRCACLRLAGRAESADRTGWTGVETASSAPRRADLRLRESARHRARCQQQTSAARTAALRSEPGARAVILHGRHHGDCRADGTAASAAAAGTTT